MGERYCPCGGECHIHGDNPCSMACFAHHNEMTLGDEPVHHLAVPEGRCRDDCPHPSHARPEPGRNDG